MRAAEAVHLAEQAIRSPVETWPGYSPANVPVCIYDPEEHYFLNHPRPPSRRPQELTAFTACDIGGLPTATIPAEMCSDETTLIPLIYHECFHGYQDSGGFRFEDQFDFFNCVAYYPEFNVPHRALCVAEAEVGEFYAGLDNSQGALHPRGRRSREGPGLGRLGRQQSRHGRLAQTGPGKTDILRCSLEANMADAQPSGRHGRCARAYKWVENKPRSYGSTSSS